MSATAGTAARIRHFDPERTRAALLAEWRAFAGVARDLTPDELDAPADLTGWTTRVLVGHVTSGIQNVARWLTAPVPDGPPLDLDRWAASTASAADAVSETAHATAAAGDSPDDAIAEAEAAMAGVPADRLVLSRVGPLTVTDMLLTRVIEVVVHSDDLERSIGRPFPHDRGALAIATRLLADVLAMRAPGRSVEVRVPPFAVVQCVEGPAHTRGTPPNIVETAPETWLRLATGRRTWAEEVAEGTVRASGSRSDLSAHLPLLG